MKSQPSILESLKLDQALKLAKKKSKEGSAEEAKNIYQDILEKFPKNKKAIYGINSLLDGVTNKQSKLQEPSREQQQALINLYGQGKLQQALHKATQLLQQFPGSAMLFNLKGAVNKELGQLDAAFEDLNKALFINPDYPDARLNIGMVLQDQGKLEKAIQSYNQALSNNPDLAINPAYAAAYKNIGNALKGVKFKKPDRSLQKIVISLLEKKNYVRPADIATSAISLLKHEPQLKRFLHTRSSDEIKRSPLEVIAALSNLPLLLTLMVVCPIPDLELEKLLKDLRASLLASISRISNSIQILKFQSALALQCFTNEYVYNQTENETKALEELEISVKQALADGKQPSPMSILCLASYKALNEYEWCDLLISTSEIEDVLIRQVIEPRQEKTLKTSFPVLEEITDGISVEVRAQYENNPYPRWVDLGLSLTPLPISMLVDKKKLRLFAHEIVSVVSPKILVAGCGTGQQSIGTAVQFKSCKVLAVDLSLSSLAYAKRKTQEFGIQNIEYMQADILSLRNLNRKFDIIESVGVLHHMDNPLDGWRALTDCLKPGGLMNIGLYSELARQPIAEMRKEINQSGIGLSDAEIKSFREKVSNSDRNHYKSVLNSGDFYSFSAVRDLLFHVQEHRFTIPQIIECLADLGLKFCGFEESRVIQSFQKNNIATDDLYDLNKWQKYEKANPTAFAGMYLLWCQKVD